MKLLAVLSMACLLLAGCASRPALVNTNPNIIVSPNGLPAPAAVTSFEGAEEYRIAPLNELTITVFGVADLSQDVQVDSLGNFAMPLIGIVHAGGRTVADVRKEIVDKLAATYLQSPQVNVFVKQYSVQRVTVEGAVQKPGILPVVGSITLLEAIAAGGDLTDLADPHAVVFRVIKGQKMGAVFDLEAIRRGAADDPQLYNDDVVVIELSSSKSRLHDFIKVAPMLSVFVLASGL